MARLDRCTICDYSEADGSDIAGLPPGANGKVRRHGEDMLCDYCQDEIAYALYELSSEDDKEVDENGSTMSVRQVK